MWSGLVFELSSYMQWCSSRIKRSSFIFPELTINLIVFFFFSFPCFTQEILFQCFVFGECLPLERPVRFYFFLCCKKSKYLLCTKIFQIFVVLLYFTSKHASRESDVNMISDDRKFQKLVSLELVFVCKIWFVSIRCNIFSQLKCIYKCIDYATAK